MKHKKTPNFLKNSCLAAFIILGIKSASADLIINEVMQSNIDFIVDDFHDFPDSWVELYNPTDKMIYFDGYKLGTSKKANKAYELPAGYAINPHSYFLIYCDKVGINHHADFRVDSGKGEIYLFKDDEIIDEVSLKAQPAPNISYGREEDMSDVWGYQLIPSPGKANQSGITDIVLGDPVFSTPGRVGSEPVQLTLSLPKGQPEGTEIRYTLNGSEPTVESLLFEEPILIEENTVVRAKLFCTGAVSPRSVTHSFIFHPREMTIPIISLVTNDEFLYSDELGIFSTAKTYGNYPNYKYDWRRPVNIEYFEGEDQIAIINQLGETKLKGSSTRDNMIKSMVLYANKRFGTKRFSYEFFPDQKPGITEFKALEIRNAGNDCYRTYMRDALAQRMMGEYADLDWQAWKPSVVYINGNYVGILNLRERSDEDNVYSNHDGLEDIDMIENWRFVEEGSIDTFLEFKKFYSEENHTMEEYAERMDVDEFANYFVLNMVYANYDFPGNNMIMWRPTEEGGKWRWICKDMDDALGNYGLVHDFNYLDWMYHPEKYPDYNWACSPDSTLLFRRVLEVPEFRSKIINRFAVYTGDFLRADNVVEKMNSMWAEFENEWPAHFEKNNPQWQPHEYFRNELENFVRRREEIIYEQVADWFELGTPIPLKITNEEALCQGIEFNDLPLATGSFEGKYFAGDPIILMAKDPQENFKGWNVEIKHDGVSTTSYYDGSVVTIITPEVEGITIYPVKDSTTSMDGIDDIIIEDGNYKYYNLSGVAVSDKELTPGLYIRTNGKKYEKIMVK